MKQSRIQEILRAYRQGENLEQDPEVRAALEASMANPQLQQLRAQQEAFDTAFADKLRQTPVPEGLHERILNAAAQADLPPSAQTPPTPEGNHSAHPLLRWVHPAFFAVAATIIIFLALSFTFWNPPKTNTAQPEFVAIAKELHRSLNPDFVSSDHQALTEYIADRGAAVPASLPPAFSWDQSFACDVFEVNGSAVSLICFETADNGKLHLYTFDQNAFPNASLPQQPIVSQSDQPAWAAWKNESNIHVLFDYKGPENLRKALDI